MYIEPEDSFNLTTLNRKMAHDNPDKIKVTAVTAPDSTLLAH